jgi:hypothetical protein
MIRALLAGTKSQTRRQIKPQPECGFIVGGPGSPACPYGVPGDLLYVKEAWRTAKSLDNLDGTKIAAKCLDAGYHAPWAPMKFEADGYQCPTWHGFGNGHEIAVPGRYRHARFMPRWASRITLRITEVRVQRLQDISDEDCKAEGIIPHVRGGWHWHKHDPLNLDDWHQLGFRTLQFAYKDLFERINGKDSWLLNDWLWCLTFEVLQKNVDEVLANG